VIIWHKIDIIIIIIGFKLPPYSECCILSFGGFPGVWILCADVSEHCFIFIGVVLTPSTKIKQSVPKRRHINSAAGELPTRESTIVFIISTFGWLAVGGIEQRSNCKNTSQIMTMHWWFLTSNSQQVRTLLRWFIVFSVACYMFRPSVVDIFREVFCEGILRRTVQQFRSVLDKRIKIYVTI